MFRAHHANRTSLSRENFILVELYGIDNASVALSHLHYCLTLESA